MQPCITGVFRRPAAYPDTMRLKVELSIVNVDSLRVQYVPFVSVHGFLIEQSGSDSGFCQAQMGGDRDVKSQQFSADFTDEG